MEDSVCFEKYGNLCAENFHCFTIHLDNSTLSKGMEFGIFMLWFKFIHTLKFFFLLFLGMIMYVNEFGTMVIKLKPRTNTFFVYF